MFCSMCGEELPNNALFCHKCGAKQNFSTETGSGTVKLILDRASQIYLLNPPIKATINGTIFASVENGHTETIEVEPGPCVLELSASIRKTTLEFDLQKDTRVEIGFNRISGKITAKIK